MTESEQDMTEGAGGVGVQRAPLNTVWVIKIVVILVILLGFGSWGLYDATLVYPKRGNAYASLCEWRYLQKLNEAEGEQFGIFLSEASVANPEAEFELLTDTETLSRLRSSASDPASTNTLRATARLNRLDWLRGLKTIGELNPENTMIEAPRARLAELSQTWATQESPKALASYDIPSQWLIVIGAWSAAAWMILLLLKTVARKYTWDPSEKRLTVARGSIVPDDLVEVDKRKWDKFIVFLRLREGHELGTGELRFDTYRHARLEDWILEMEETRFGPQEDGEKPSGEGEPGGDGPGGDEPSEAQQAESEPGDAQGATKDRASDEPEKG